MRTLKFIVEGQKLKPDPNCNFDDLVPGTDGYLQAEFSFSEEWKDCIKVAGFYRAGVEYPPQPLKDGRTCMIPTEVLAKPAFAMRIFGRLGDFRLTTNKVIVSQNGGK